MVSSVSPTHGDHRLANARPRRQSCPDEPLIRRMSVKASRRKVDAGLRHDAETTSISDSQIGHFALAGYLEDGCMNSQQEMRPAAVITGASDGIGRAIGRYIARERGVVVLVARSPERLAATADELRQAVPSR